MAFTQSSGVFPLLSGIPREAHFRPFHNLPKLSRIASNPEEINKTRITSQSLRAVTPRESNLCMARGQNAKSLGIIQP